MSFLLCFTYSHLHLFIFLFFPTSPTTRCNGTTFHPRRVSVLLKLDVQGTFKYAALQSAPGKAALCQCGRGPNDISSIVYIPDEVTLPILSTAHSTSSFPPTSVSNVPAPIKHFIKSEAVVQIVKRLGLPIGVISSMIPLAFKDEVAYVMQNEAHKTAFSNNFNLHIILSCYSRRSMIWWPRIDMELWGNSMNVVYMIWSLRTDF